MKKNSVNQVVKEMDRTKKQLEKEVVNLKEHINSKQLTLTEKIEELKALDGLLSKFEEVQLNKEKQDMKEVKKEQLGKRELKKHRKDTIIGSIISMLEDKPMHYKEIINNLRLMGFPMNGKKPEASMIALLSRDERFTRVEKGTYLVNKEQVS